jgi:hypothetical protein
MDCGYSGSSDLSSCNPSYRECVIPWRCVWGGESMSAIGLLNSVTVIWPMSAHMMGQRPPFDFHRSWSSSRNVLLWRLVLSLAMYLQPPSMCVFVSEDWHFVHMRDGQCFLLHLWMCTPQATSSESLLARKGALEYAWIVWSDPEVLAVCRIWL